MFHTLGALKNRVARGAEETETNRRIELERHLLHSVDMTVAATPLDREQMVQHYAADPARIVVVPPGVDTDLFQPGSRTAARARLGLPADAPLLLSVGRMEPLKGMDTLIEALALLRSRHPSRFANLGALLVGGAPETRPEDWNSEQQRLAALRTSLGVAEAVTFAGAADHAALHTYYAAADVYVLASRYESFGMAALEALACGTPVAASNAGGPAILIQPEQSGLLVPPADAPALADALERLLSNAALHQRLSQGGRQRASQYDWARIAEEICRVYDASIEAYASKEYDV
jgi:D-inositol-3-phosphate glycosyltransferase